ncbi:toll/interleukin-1 receptor domain-containing protein [Paenarthrobacter sp. MMS21-TAE1-1]|uniref:Toll/interleukin-1 receptor domain-containing protein n=1 Tax=Paenarthrobacter aromaticivorans TaxID=2849150 RepID=A0ABS6I1P7_9MICC|nr:toll/interleukin-1 receptor domain-containing protein [Paenarthrobacter sp. MMS21-TAE1-1]
MAQAIYKCLPSLFDNAKPWISTENRSGSIWLPEIDKQLSDTDFGIVCVSKQNQGAPWLNYEAGALSRKVDAKRELMPVLLVDFDDTVEVTGPVTGFQMKFANLEDFFVIMKDLNESELGPGIDADILRMRVELIWPSIEAEVKKVKSSHDSQDVKKRTDDDKYEELLVTVRDIAETTAILAHQRWGGPGQDFRLSDHDMRVVAKAVGDVGRATGLGEMSITFPDKKRARVGSENPVNDVIAGKMANAVAEILEHDIEISYYPMDKSEIEDLRAMLAMRNLVSHPEA